MLGQTNCPYYYTRVSIEQGSTAFYTLQQSFIVFINSAFCCKNVFFSSIDCITLLRPNYFEALEKVYNVVSSFKMRLHINHSTRKLMQ